MKNLKILKAIIIMIVFGTNINAQVKIGDNPTTINSSSILEMESTDKGILLPRMTTTQRDAISSPANGLKIYNTTTGLFNYYNGSLWKVIESEARDYHVLVKSAADLPAAVGGVIILDSNIVYEINGSISVADKIDLNDTEIYGLDEFSDHLIYTGSEELFTGSNGGTVRDLEIHASTSPGVQLFNLSDPGRTKILHIRDVVVDNTSKLGTIIGYELVYIQNAECKNNDDGFTFGGTNHLILSDLLFFSSNKGTHIKLEDGSMFHFIELTGGFFHVSAANSSTGFDFGTGVTVMHGGELETNFHGDGTRITGTPNKSWDITSHGVDVEADVVATGNFYITGSATTAIAAVNTPIKIAGTTTATNLFRITMPVDNRLTYDGTKTRTFIINCALSLIASSNGKRFNFYIAKNGTIMPETKQRRKIANGGDVGVVALSGIVSLSPGDYIEVWIENTNDTSNVTVESMNLSIL